MNKKAVLKKKILYLVSEDHYFCSHRLSLAQAALQEGYEVVVATRVLHHQHLIEQTGIRVIPLYSFHRSRLNPFKELQSLKEIIKIYRQEKPTIVHHVALKLVLYGGLAALWTKVPRVIHALGGLGYLFISKTLKAQLLRWGIMRVLKPLFCQKKSTLILQNGDDYRVFLHAGVSENHLALIPGSGVNLTHFKATEEPPVSEKGPVIAFVSRMLKDKGAYELIQAARLLKERSVPFQLRFYGTPDPLNPTTLSEDELYAWKKEGLIQWEGSTQEVSKAYQNAHMAVLPSYREGLPKSLIEAAACARPIITTDVPGCRDVVVSEETGLLVPPQNSLELSRALERLLKNKAERIKMGKKGRERAEKDFDEKIIIQKILKLYKA